MTKITKKQEEPLKPADTDLILSILGRFNAIILFDDEWGILNISIRKSVNMLEDRLKNKLTQLAISFDHVRNQIHDFNRRLFEELRDELIKFAEAKGFGDDYSRRLAINIADSLHLASKKI